MKYNWPLIKLEYITDPEQPSFRQLAERFAPAGKKKSLQNLIERRAKREGWVKAREEFWAKVGQKWVEKSLEWAEVRLQELRQFASKALEIEMKALDRYKKKLDQEAEFSAHELAHLRTVSEKLVNEIWEWEGRPQRGLPVGLIVSPEIVEFLRRRFCLDLEKLVKRGVPTKNSG